MVTINQNVYFFFDDSGVLHRKEQSGFFVYAGFVFTSREELDGAKRKYINANRKIKSSLGVDKNTELKASMLVPKHKRALLNSILEYQSLSATVDIRRVYDYILNDKKSICRYKDYVLKRSIKRKLQELIRIGEIDQNRDIHLQISIDEQLTATNGYYDLRDSISEELQHGIINFDYGIVHPNLFNCHVKVDIRYCESKNNFLIQASDIIANRIWTSYCVQNPSLRRLPNHTALTFP